MRRAYIRARSTHWLLQMSKNSNNISYVWIKRQTEEKKRDQLFWSPVKETIELDTKFVCTHARVIYVTRHRRIKQKQKNNKSCSVYIYWTLGLRSWSVARTLGDMQQVHTLVVGLSPLLLFLCSSFTMFPLFDSV